MFVKTIVDKLREDFPSESVQIRAILNKKGETSILTGYKPQYIIERLNDTFGHDAWDFEVLKYDIVDKYVWVLGRLTVYSVAAAVTDPNATNILDINHRIMYRDITTVKDQFGTSFIGEMGVGDALKGAATNSLEKCASMLDIGHMAYKGLLPAPKEDIFLNKENKPSNINIREKDETEEELKIKLKNLCTKYQIGKVGLTNLIKNILKKDIAIVDLKELDDFKKLIKHIEVNKAPF